ncbi:carboxypeptidase-like regulatory domain-containing protein [uncultured Aquimarina sp.]|uniref:carboxypeptidase-like regulatory domain-containing protein n=1 Tax=uncultured Aquimarina sp. TaxID=575652 RepID=UPI00260950C4|nr:carboxypeptidase-like regulatory domain-containing protein [uncultured Aquimarina sp.]
MSLFSKLTPKPYFFLFIFQSIIVFGQQSEFIQGKLVDSKTKEPISFATIRIKNKSQGLISNADGGFKIPTNIQNISDTLVVSSIGYISKNILLSQLKSEQVNVISLVQKIEELEEVVVTNTKKIKRYGANIIVRLAIEKIPENHPFSPFSYVGYYRDYQIKDQSYINLNEAILEVFDKGFESDDLQETKIKILEYKNNLDFPVDTIAAKPYNYVNRDKIISNNATLNGQGGNEYTLLRLHDALRNYRINTYDFVNRFNRNFIKNHRFKILPSTSIDNIPLYTIGISKTQQNIKVSGKIYISKGDFKIYKMIYSVFDSSKPEDEEKNTTEKTSGKLLYEIIIEYQERFEKMYPSYISFDNTFETSYPPKFFPEKVYVNQMQKRFEIVLNKRPFSREALRKRNYSLWYYGTKLQIDSIRLLQKNIYIYPKKRKLVFGTKLISKQKKQSHRAIAIEIKNIRDLEGNLINQRESVSFHQYREFFVQELSIDTKAIRDSLFMIKTKPIFKSKSVISPEILSNYWMNTPLKN